MKLVTAIYATGSKRKKYAVCKLLFTSRCVIFLQIVMLVEFVVAQRIFLQVLQFSSPTSTTLQIPTRPG